MQKDCQQSAQGAAKQKGSPSTAGRRDIVTPGLWYRLASGDAEGRVVCWDMHTGQAISGLDDAWQAATGSRNSTRSGEVRALAWVMSGPCLLAVALSNMLIIWDPRGMCQ